MPVVKNAGEKNFLALQRAINDLAERARAKKLKPEEVQESTFSITNPGIFGGLMGLPVINQPNVAILAIGAIQKRPVVVDDAIAIRSMVYLTLELRPSRRGRRHRAPVHGAGEAAPGNLERRNFLAAAGFRRRCGFVGFAPASGRWERAGKAACAAPIPPGASAAQRESRAPRAGR